MAQRQRRHVFHQVTVTPTGRDRFEVVVLEGRFYDMRIFRDLNRRAVLDMLAGLTRGHSLPKAFSKR
jgi:hypothetical protein